jgi:hypothetical protein
MNILTLAFTPALAWLAMVAAIPQYGNDLSTSSPTSTITAAPSGRSCDDRWCQNGTSYCVSTPTSGHLPLSLVVGCVAHEHGGKPQLLKTNLNSDSLLPQLC